MGDQNNQKCLIVYQKTNVFQPIFKTSKMFDRYSNIQKMISAQNNKNILIIQKIKIIKKY